MRYLYHKSFKQVYNKCRFNEYEEDVKDEENVISVFLELIVQGSSSKSSWNA